MGKPANLGMRDSALSDLYSRICVRRPYFALRELRTDAPGTADCVVPVELLPGRELAPITVAESGRHLAILGLCAAVTSAPVAGRRYYLARSARIHWLPDSPLSTNGRLIGSASARHLSRRRATADTTLAVEGGAPIARIELDYDVLTVGAFERLFAHAHRPGPGKVGVASPYRRPLPLRNVDRDDRRVSAVVVATPEDCAGHFPAYPTIPVAVLGQAMIDAAGTLVDRRWRTRTVDVAAHRLVPAGTSITLTATVTERVGHEVTLSVAATDGETAVADLVLRIGLA